MFPPENHRLKSHVNAPSDRPAWLPMAPYIFLLFWSGGFTAAKIGLEYSTPLAFLTARYLLVLVILIPPALVLRPALPKNIETWRAVILTGAIVQGCYFSITYIAFALGVSASLMALLVSLQPILVALAAPRLAGERINRSAWIGLMLGLAGAVLVIQSRAQMEIVTPIGVGLCLIALFTITAGTLFEKRHGAGGHLVMINLIQYTTGLIIVVPLMLLFETPQVSIGLPFAATVGYLAVANSLIGISLLLAMIRHGAVTKVSALFFLVPPMASIIAWLVIGEPMSPTVWIGLAVATIGVALATRAPLSESR